jgi:hypothetical protein
LTLAFQHFLEFAKHSVRKSKITDNGWKGGKVLVLALWQKGNLRQDVINLAKEAKSLGFRVVAVNNKRASFTGGVPNYFDTYIERSNFGRDFGAYREGILYLKKSKKLDQNSRLVILNDSVFFLKQNLAKMLEGLADPAFDFTGATENFEFDHHFGSFALGFSSEILNDKRFFSYWQNYRLTNFRPEVIKRGEMGITKLCMSISQSSRAKAFVSRKELSSFLHTTSTKGKIDGLFMLLPEANKLWEKTPTLTEIARRVLRKNLISMNEFANADVLQSASSGNDFLLISDVSSLAGFIDSVSGDRKGAFGTKKTIATEITTSVYNHIVRGSQIHTGCILFLKMGLPIVKLDLVYRGIADYGDVQKLLSQIEDPEEREQLFDMLSARPFGSDTLRGWKRAAFESGWL